MLHHWLSIWSDVQSNLQSIRHSVTGIQEIPSLVLLMLLLAYGNSITYSNQQKLSEMTRLLLSTISQLQHDHLPLMFSAEKGLSEEIRVRNFSVESTALTVEPLLICSEVSIGEVFGGPTVNRVQEFLLVVPRSKTSLPLMW